MSMSFKITTTGAVGAVTFDDLGERTFTHPTVSYDLSIEYTLEEIRESADVQSAIDSGYITVDDGSGNSITDTSTISGGDMTASVYDRNADNKIDKDKMAIFNGPGNPGIVPDPITSTNLFLRDDGTFANPNAGDVSVNTGNSQTVENTTVETNFTSNGTNYTLPGNTVNQYSVLRFLVYGRFSALQGDARTLTIRLKIGRTVINTNVIDIDPDADITDAGFQFTGQLHFRTIGATGTVYSHLLCVFDEVVQESYCDTSNGTTTVDTTTGEIIQMSAQWSVADPNNSITVEQVTFEIMN